MPLKSAHKPDPILCKDQLQLLQDMHKALGTNVFCAIVFWALTKKPVRFKNYPTALNTVPFKFNLVQRILQSGIADRNLILKARQQGLTTYLILVRLLLQIVLHPGRNAFLMAHNGKYAENDLRMAKRAWRLFAAEDPNRAELNSFSESIKRNLLHLSYSNRRELIFSQLDSTLLIGTAEVEEEGQSLTIHHFVADEYSRWPGDPRATLSNIISVNTFDIACTANGMAGPFWEEVELALTNPAKSSYKFHFFEWYKTEEYTLELSEKEKDELEADLASDELSLIRKIHKDLAKVAHV